jgi:hypothetical protein
MALTPSPQTAAEIAQLVIPWVQEKYGVTLDYTPFSLRQIDGIIDDLRHLPFESAQPLLFSMGCYVGEMFVKHAGGTWRTAEEVGMSAVASSPIVIQLADGRACNPVGRVYKRFKNGPEENIAYFFHVITTVPAEQLAPRDRRPK